MIYLKHFTEDEFMMGAKEVADMMDPDFLLKLDELRKAVGFKLTINSSYRTPEYNKRIGGSKGSKHMEGIAADLKCKKSNKRAIIVREALKLGLSVGVAKTFIHIDNRGNQLMFTY